jgi:hypothetical protein
MGWECSSVVEGITKEKNKTKLFIPYKAAVFNHGCILDQLGNFLNPSVPAALQAN